MKSFFKDLAEKFVIISSDHEERARKLKEEKHLKLVGLEDREEENVERYLKSPSGVNGEVSGRRGKGASYAFIGQRRRKKH